MERDEDSRVMEEVGMEFGQRLQKICDRAVEECQVAGVNLLVLQDGREVVYLESGEADIENHIPLRRDSIFRLYSQTKPVTAVAAGILVERGELELCQGVADFLPAYRSLTVCTEDGKIRKAKNTLLVHHLMNMTSGLSYPGDNNASDRGSAIVFDEAVRRLRTDREMSTIELAERLAEYPLAYEPGSSWQYGTSADVLGAVIEKASGMSLAEFCEKEIFAPLGMKDTAFYVPKEKQSRLAKVYETVCRAEGNTMVPYLGDNLAINNLCDRLPAFQSGGAGLMSTLDDYRKFATMLLNGGTYEGARILSPRMTEYLTTGDLTADQQKGFDHWIGLCGHTYANLMRVCNHPSRAAMLAQQGEYGWDGWLGMYFANFPKERITILMGTQKRDAGTFTLTRSLRNVILAELCK